VSQRVARYARPNAKLRGMISRLLSTEHLQALAASPDLEGALRLLSETPYRATVAGLMERGEPLADVERAVEGALVDAYRRTALLLTGEGKELVVVMVRRVELDNLKTVLRAKARGASLESVHPLLVSLGDLSEMPIDELLRAEDVESVASRLAETEYGRVLRGALPRFVTERSLFSVEVALDLNYYRRLWESIGRLRGLDHQVVGRIMGIRYDTLNVEWIVRYRLAYGLSPEEIFNYALPYGWRIDDENVRRASAAEGMEGIAGALPEPYRSLLLAVARAPDPVGHLGLLLSRYLVAVARSSVAGYPFHLGVAVAYLWLKEAEVHDLRLVLESMRYDRPAERIVEMMWGVT
jgi:V/A-type H+/Na+-transporting ATPase subunit C